MINRDIHQNKLEAINSIDLLFEVLLTELVV